MSEIEKMYENCNFEKSMGVGSPLALHPFTAEKQIEILKLILKKRRILAVGYIIEYGKYDCPHYKYGSFDTFEEALCADLNYHWQDLTLEEKQQVREILE